jgi:hypothetical protein
VSSESKTAEYFATPGSATRAAADAAGYGKVKSVNRLAPDSTGNVDISAGVGAGSSLFEAIPFYVYGNSYTVGSRATAGGEWPKRVHDRLRMGAMQSAGLGGAVMGQVAYEANNNVSGATPSRAWVTGSKGLIVLEETINDAVTFGDTPAARAGYVSALRALVETFRALTRIDATNAAITYSSGWTSGTAYLKASGKKVATAGATATFTVTGDECTVYVMGSSGLTNTPVVEISNGGTVLATVDMAAQMAAYNTPGTVGTGISSNLTPIRVTGLGPGASTLVVKSVNANNLYFDGYSTPNLTSPPQIIFVKEGIITNYSPHGSSTSREMYNSLMDDVAAEYPGIVSIADPRPNWDTSCLYMGDGTGNHPNDKGQAVIADAVIAAAVQLGYVNGMHTL